MKRSRFSLLPVLLLLAVLFCQCTAPAKESAVSETNSDTLKGSESETEISSADSPDFEDILWDRDKNQEWVTRNNLPYKNVDGKLPVHNLAVPDELNGASPIAYSGQKVIFLKSSALEGDTDEQAIYSYDVTNGEMRFLAQHPPLPFISSGDYCRVENRLYFYALASENTSEQLALYCLDLSSGELQIVLKESFTIPMRYLYAGPANTLFVYSPSKEGEDSYVYRIQKIDLLSGSSKTIYETRADGKIEITTPNIGYSDGRLYAYQRLTSEKTLSNDYIQVLDENGKRLVQIPFPFGEELVKANDRSDAIWNLEVFGDYAFVETLSGGGILTRISSAPSLIAAYNHRAMQIVKGSQTLRYVVFTDNDKGGLHCLDTKTGELLKADLDFPNDEVDFTHSFSYGSAVCNEKGDFVLPLAQMNAQGEATYHYFSFTEEELRQEAN